MGLEVAFSAFLEEHQGQGSASEDLPNVADPDLDVLHSDAEIAKPLETIAIYVGWQCAAPDPAVGSRSKTALLWAKASRPLEPFRVRECNMALLLGSGCRAEHERTDRLYVNQVHWTNAQRTKGKNVCLDEKDAAIFSTPFHHEDQDLSTRWHPHDQTRALEAALS